MLRAGIVGLGKMGVSHAAILGAHPSAELVAACDTSSLVLNAFKKYSKIATYDDYSKMLNKEELDLLVIASPTKFHYQMTKSAFDHNINVFCEKPFSLSTKEGTELVKIAKQKSLINQVGYHNHFIGTFVELKKLINDKVIGEIVHFNGEAYGPVVTKEKGSTWRSKSNEGGGCMLDYASHLVNLIQELIGRPVKVNGALLKSIYSSGVDDAVYTLLTLDNNISGTMLVNWSDETYRKMSTSITLFGKNGKIICDATELKIYLKESNKEKGFEKGWNTRYITDYLPVVDFHLRGEEYSAQIDYFIHNILQQKQGELNTFEQGLYTDKVIEMIYSNANNN